MSDTPQGPGWWMADDGKWYSPERRAGDSTAAPPAPAGEPVVDAPRTAPAAPVGDAADVSPDATDVAPTPVEPASAAASNKGRRRVGIIAAIAAIGVLAGGVAALLLTDDDNGEAFAAPDEGEVFLEPADDIGDNAFTDIAFVQTPEVTIDVDVPDSGDDAIGASRGSTAGLYGGTRDDTWCDPDTIAGFLDDHPDHAAAFIDALATDPTWRSDTTTLEPEELAGYLDTMTSTLLTADTRFTNHGYRDGEPLPFQAVLQAGTAVLVDTNGVPRVRCACGNPLTAPAAVRGTVTYTGTQWTGFDTTRLMVIQPAQRPIDVFILVDITTGERFERPTGTTGNADRPVGGQPEPTPTTAPPTTAPPTTTPPTTEAVDQSGEQLEAIHQWVLSNLSHNELSGWCDDYEMPSGVDPYEQLLPWCASRPEGRGDEATSYVVDPGGISGGLWLRLVRGPDGWAVVESNYGGPPS